MALEVGEIKLDLPSNDRLNQYSHIGLMKGASEDDLVKQIAEYSSPIFVKAIYFSPTSNLHVAYVLTNKPLSKEVEND